ncbi:hypothetical protein AAEU42_09710 [Pseudoflavonifractor phocaeensis]|uniref:hypothetical protein n=1 Tax=Pseudoflavonifractor phocaeensis TaxID=1870988 RepID=UPI00313AC58E
MGIPVLILGESGSGKSASLRSFSPDEVGVFNVASKPLPFRKPLKMVNSATYADIAKGLSAPKLKTYVIDDSQYLLAFEFFDRAQETGYNKFTDIALNFRNLIQFVITKTPPDRIVYFLHHTEKRDDGTLKAKTIGRMLDEKLTVEGLFSIVLLCRSTKDRHYFVTQSEGYSTAKSPMDMFPPEIDNDLKAVDDAIRAYYDLNKEEIKQ